MGKMSSIAVILLMANIIGYLLTIAAIEDGFGGNLCGGAPDVQAYVSGGSMLGSLYVRQPSLTDNSTNHGVYLINGSSTIYGDVPTQTPSSFIQQGVSFIDRIFVIFGFIKTMLAVLFWPIEMMSVLCIPYQIGMLFLAPLVLLYILGLIDLITGGSS